MTRRILYISLALTLSACSKDRGNDSSDAKSNPPVGAAARGRYAQTAAIPADSGTGPLSRPGFQPQVVPPGSRVAGGQGDIEVERPPAPPRPPITGEREDLRGRGTAAPRDEGDLRGAPRAEVLDDRDTSGSYPRYAQIDPSERTRADATRAPKAPSQCVGLYAADHPDWFPGLPTPPSEPRFRSEEDGPKSIRYTDAGRDGLMAAAIQGAEARGEVSVKKDRELAERIASVRVNFDVQRRLVRVALGYEVRGQVLKIVLEGPVLESPREAVLKQTSSEADGQFAGRAICVDADGGCQNVLVSLQLLSPSGKVGREVQIVHRWGDAHLNITDEDLMGGERLRNSAHRAFAEYVSNTAINSCLSTLRGEANPCNRERLERLCGQAQPRSNYARAITLRTWAIVYGRAGFDLALLDQEATARTQPQARIILSGPMVVSRMRPMSQEKLHVQGQTGISRADLIANDGAGHMNLQLVFAGSPQSHTRLNVSSTFVPTRKVQFAAPPAPQAPKSERK